MDDRSKERQRQRQPQRQASEDCGRPTRTTAWATGARYAGPATLAAAVFFAAATPAALAQVYPGTPNNARPDTRSAAAQAGKATSPGTGPMAGPASEPNDPANTQVRGPMGPDRNVPDAVTPEATGTQAGTIDATRPMVDGRGPTVRGTGLPATTATRIDGAPNTAVPSVTRPLAPNTAVPAGVRTAPNTAVPSVAPSTAPNTAVPAATPVAPVVPGCSAVTNATGRR